MLLDPKFELFSLSEQHYAEPPDFQLILLREPRLWSNIVMAALFRRARTGADMTETVDEKII